MFAFKIRLLNVNMLNWELTDTEECFIESWVTRKKLLYNIFPLGLENFSFFKNIVEHINISNTNYWEENKPEKFTWRNFISIFWKFSFIYITFFTHLSFHFYVFFPKSDFFHLFECSQGVARGSDFVGHFSLCYYQRNIIYI